MATARPIILYAFLSLLLLDAAAAAGVYKWTDETGQVHYGDNPPAEDAVPLEIHGHPGPDPELIKRQQKRRRLLDVLDEDRQRRREQEKAQQREREEMDRRCARARRNLKATLNASYLYEKTGDPYNPRILSQEERRVETDLARKQVEIWCR